MIELTVSDISNAFGICISTKTTIYVQPLEVYKVFSTYETSLTNKTPTMFSQYFIRPVCVCVCVHSHAQTHTHTRIYVIMYVQLHHSASIKRTDSPFRSTKRWQGNCVEHWPNQLPVSSRAVKKSVRCAYNDTSLRVELYPGFD